MSGKALLLITGADQGLGYSAVQQLSATNTYRILLGSRDVSKAEKAIETLTDDESIKAKRANVEPIQIDMSSDESISAAAKKFEEKYGYLDILTFNAGISWAKGILREQYKQVYDTNVFGAAVTVDTFLPLLRKSTVRGGRRIVFTSADLSSLQNSTYERGPVQRRQFPNLSLDQDSFEHDPRALCKIAGWGGLCGQRGQSRLLCNEPQREEWTQRSTRGGEDVDQCCDGE